MNGVAARLTTKAISNHGSLVSNVTMGNQTGRNRRRVNILTIINPRL
jgi:hypothetical protein